MRLLALLTSLLAAAAYLPGVPPQCLPAYACAFTRTISGRAILYDLCPLCRPAGAEYVAFPAGAPAGALYPQIRFNVAGSVSRVIATIQNTSSGWLQVLPFPRSHGVAVQFVDDPDGPGVNPDHYAAVDTDTCDQATNPGCGPLNYASCDGNGAPIIPATECNPARQAACAASAQALPYCSPSMNASYVTGAVEVLAYPDGGAPIYSLFDESDPLSGVNLTFPAIAHWMGDPFSCTTLDPPTGYATQRTVNIFIACDASVAGLAVDAYSEPSECHYFITARSALACGSNLSPTPTPAPSPFAAAGMSAAAVYGAIAGAFVGGAAVAVGARWLSAKVSAPAAPAFACADDQVATPFLAD
jgi:hypothetical protein